MKLQQIKEFSTQYYHLENSNSTSNNIHSIDTEAIVKARMESKNPVWFAMKAIHKEKLAMELFTDKNIRYFFPTVSSTTTIRGEKVIKERALIPGTIFVYASYNVLNELKRVYTYLTFSYRRSTSGFKILKVPESEMERFIDSATKMKNNIHYFQPNELELKKGNRVRIVGGPLDGYEGVLLKAKGRAKRMFLIDFNILGSLGTYVEPQFIQVIK